ncbi:MAG: helix-turn-helix domain-containing protein, partial [Pseudomonadota bacterium]
MNDETQNETMDRLNQLSNFLTYRVSRLHGKLNAQASKILKDSVGITLNQWRMIAFIGGARTITASELIHYTAMDKGLISRNVRSLIELGYVVSSEHETDHRLHVL